MTYVPSKKVIVTEHNGIRVGSWVRVKNDCGQVTKLLEGHYQFAVRLYNQHASMAYRVEEVELWKW